MSVDTSDVFAYESRLAPRAVNQYRQGSGYKDVIGRLYHFPVRYQKAFSDVPSAFVYYEPREGGEQIYFGAGTVVSVYEDTEDVAHAYAELVDYREFATPVGFYTPPIGRTWENPKTMRNSVRRISAELFEGILTAGGIESFQYPTPEIPESVAESLRRELNNCPEPGKRSPLVLRKIRRILESFERPSTVTNYVKRTRGDTCQVCGTPGFVKRDGRRYCELHHLFHIADDPPADCLSPEYLVVLCANCHRRMHYGDVSAPVATAAGWAVKIDGLKVPLNTRRPGESIL